MAMKLHTKTIAGERWSLKTLPATTGLEVLTWLVGTMGAAAPAMAGAVAGKQATSLEAMLQLEVADGIGEAIAAVGRELAKPDTTEKLKQLLGELQKGGEKDAKDVAFDDEFAGDYLRLLEVVRWALEVNFGSFFGAAIALGGRAGGKAAGA